MARDYFCPAGKRGFCKHIAALASKLADCIMRKKENIPSTLTFTQIKQKWGVPKRNLSPLVCQPLSASYLLFRLAKDSMPLSPVISSSEILLGETSKTNLG